MRLVQVLAASSLLLGCSHVARPAPPAPSGALRPTDLRQPAPLSPVDGDRVLSKEELEQDLGLLGYALDRGYGGREFVPAEDWARMTTRLDTLRGQGMTVERLCEEVAEALWLLPDAHLSAMRAVPDDGARVRCGESARGARRAGTVGLNLAASAERPWRFETRTVNGRSLALLAITSFPSGGAPAWEGFDDAVAAIMKSDGLIVDLRGNGGGDDSRAYQLAGALLDGPVSTGSLRTHKRQTPETLTLWLNLLEQLGRGPDGTLAPHLRELHAQTEAQLADALAGKIPPQQVLEKPPSTVAPGPQAFAGKIAVLVDEACMSSCESGMEVLALHPNAQVFGRRTAGFIHFGNVAGLFLPNSRIRIGVPTKYAEYPDGKLYDKVGFEPDVELPAGADAFAEALQWVQ